jgi:nitrogen fixation/metabolism regulation signal transduction histidine kinase
MNDDLGRIGLEFFGKVTASISHEIKNRLAVINEQAGLLEDHVLMSQKGHEMNLDRLKKLSATVQRQVALANTVIKNMNRFAHSSDALRQPVDLNEALSLSAALSQRAADMREVSLAIKELAEPKTVTTSFFRLLNLFWICLNAAIEMSAARDEITAELDDTGGRVVLLVRTAAAAGRKISEEKAAAAGRLAADLDLPVELDPAAGRIVVHF